MPMKETHAYGSMHGARSPKAEMFLLPLTRQHVALGTTPAHPCYITPLGATRMVEQGAVRNARCARNRSGQRGTASGNIS